MAAGVGTAALRGEGEPALLTHGQSVHIGPEQEHLPVGLSGQGGGDAPSQPPGLIAHLGQPCHDIGTGLGQVHPHLGMLVEVPAVPDHLFIQRLSALKIIHTMSSPFRSPVPILGKMDHPDLPHPVQHPGAQDAQGDAGQDGDAAVDWCDEHVD